jgi:hypothetical protein
LSSLKSGFGSAARPSAEATLNTPIRAKLPFDSFNDAQALLHFFLHSRESEKRTIEIFENKMINLYLLDMTTRYGGRGRWEGVANKSVFA